MGIEYKFVKEEDIKEFKDKEWERFNKENNYEYKPKVFSLAAYLDDEIAGVAYFDIVGGVGHLKELIVKKEARGKKIGLELMKLYEEKCISEGCHKLLLQTTPLIMEEAVSLYKKNGFEVVSELKDHEFHFDNVLMVKEVNKNDN